MPRRSARLVIGLACAAVVAAQSSVAAAAPHAPADRLAELRLELARLEVPIATGTSFWLAIQARVKAAQAGMQHDRRVLHTGPGAAAAKALRADLLQQRHRIAPLLPSWLWVKALLHRNWHQVKLTLLQVRRVVAATLGKQPGAIGAAAWQRVFQRPPPTAAALQRSRLDVCPVDGLWFSVDTFGAPRPGGRVHEGIDLQTARGTPIAAALPGFVRRVPNTLGGNAVIVDSAGGTYAYYAHLSAYGASGPVRPGEVIGYAGATGDARGLIPHLHFELHPGGGPAVDAVGDLQAVC